MKEKALGYFRDKVNTKAELDRFWLDFPDELVIEKLYLEDQEEDTLAYVEELRASADMWGLFKGELNISHIGLKGFVGKMSRNEADSAFNFDYIIEAFTTPIDSSTVAQDTTAGSFDITIQNVDVENSRFYYTDPIAGFDMQYAIGNFSVEISEFDLEQMLVHVSEVVLENSQGKFVQTKIVPPSEDEEEPIVFDLDIQDVAINDVKFTFESIPSELELYTHIGKIDGSLEKIDIMNMDYIADELNFENILVELDLRGEALAENSTLEETALDSIILNVAANKLTFDNINFRFDDHTAPETAGFDPMHFTFTNINGEFTDPAYRLEGEDSYASGMVESLTLKEDAGMTLEKLSGRVEFTPTYTLAENFDMAAGQSEFTGDLRITYPSLAALAENPESLGFDVDVEPSRVHLNDVLHFVPDLASQFSILPQASRLLQFSGDIQGTVGDMDINSFRANGLNNTNINIAGAIKGLPDINKVSVDLAIRQFETSRADLEAILPDTLIPADITIPETLAIKGNVAGNINTAKGNLIVNTSMGNAHIDASINMETDSVYAYTGKLKVENFNVGKLINQEEMMGSLTMNINADGRGFTMEDINTSLTGVVDSFSYNNYTYKGLEVDGRVAKMEFTGNLEMDDENLDFAFEGTVDMNDSIPAYMFDLKLNNADLQALNFMDEEFTIEGKIDSDLRANNFEQIRGHIYIDDVEIVKNGQDYFIDSLIFRSEYVGRETNITIASDILDASFKGEFEVIRLPQVIQAHINQYYALLDTTSLEGIQPQSFTFNIDIKRTDLLTDVLIPELKTFEPEQISGTYDSENWAMDINLIFSEINYAGTVFDSLGIHLTSDEEALTYDVKLASLKTAVLPIDNIWLEGYVASNHINTALHILNEKGEDKYLYGGIFTSWEENYYQLQLTPGRIIMDYENWDVYPGNAIRFFGTGIMIEDLRLTQNEQTISIESTIDDKNDTLITMGFGNFDLATFNDLAQQDSTFIGGLLNGKADINTSAETFAFTSNLSIRDLSYHMDTLGNLSLNAYSTQVDRYDVTASLDGGSSMAMVEGYYEADSSTGILHFDIDIDKLAFTVVEAFSFGELKDSRGNLKGEIAIRGTMADPDINGELTFDDVLTRLTYLNAWAVIDDETLSFNKQGINLNRFVIRDGSNNEFVINGKILTEDYSYFRFNLDGTMRDFLMLNTGAGDNPLFYGSLIVDSDLRVRGDSDLPVINMNIALNEGSRLTYIVPETEIAHIEREGLIEFIDLSAMNWTADSVMMVDSIPGEEIEARFKGINFTANIELIEANTFTIVIDPATGDRLSNLRGNASLTLNINPTGDITLNGRYTVDEGLYTMRFFGLAQREFSVVDGSYILWTGDPLDARMDIRAEYEVLASPMPLVGGRETSGDMYGKQPILVYLDLEGRLLKPDIGFQLAMPEDEQRSNIMGMLQEINSQESRLLEEVLSLVVFRRFSGGNILQGGGGGPESTARQSVSRVLSQQLNQLGSRVKGVDISFDVQSYQDYSQTGQSYNRTDVELGLSKQFFDDRVIVKVAGNFNVEGQERQTDSQNMADFAGDIIVEYLITEDGRFRLMGFRQNEYDDLLQGEITETGIGIIFVKDYNSFKELFSDMNNSGG